MSRLLWPRSAFVFSLIWMGIFKIKPSRGRKLLLVQVAAVTKIVSANFLVKEIEQFLSFIGQSEIGKLHEPSGV